MAGLNYSFFFFMSQLECVYEQCLFAELRQSYDYDSLKTDIEDMDFLLVQFEQSVWHMYGS